MESSMKAILARIFAALTSKPAQSTVALVPIVWSNEPFEQN